MIHPISSSCALPCQRLRRGNAKCSDLNVSEALASLSSSLDRDRRYCAQDSKSRCQWRNITSTPRQLRNRPSKADELSRTLGQRTRAGPELSRKITMISPLRRQRLCRLALFTEMDTRSCLAMRSFPAVELAASCMRACWQLGCSYIRERHAGLSSAAFGGCGWIIELLKT